MTGAATKVLAATALPPAVVGAFAIAAPPAHAVTGCEGVRVVVDPGPLPGRVSDRCVETDGEAFAAASTRESGVDITWVQRYPGAFVCRLDGRPADLPCASTPPADRYWGLFWAAPGDRQWTYATQGAQSLAVPAGGAVGWRLQDGGQRETPAVAPFGAAGQPAGSGDQGGRAGVGAEEQARNSGARLATAAGLALVAGLAVTALVMRRRV